MLSDTCSYDGGRRASGPTTLPAIIEMSSSSTSSAPPIPNQQTPRVAQAGVVVGGLVTKCQTQCPLCLMEINAPHESVGDHIEACKTVHPNATPAALQACGMMIRLWKHIDRFSRQHAAVHVDPMNMTSRDHQQPEASCTLPSDCPATPACPICHKDFKVTDAVEKKITHLSKCLLEADRRNKQSKKEGIVAVSPKEIEMAIALKKAYTFERGSRRK
eukprot:PhF_6_TR39127/c0_g1_i1/m.58558